MNISYDQITEAFLDKILEFELFQLDPEVKQSVVDGYMKRAVSKFKSMCNYDLSATDSEERVFTANFNEADVDDIVDIISDGMVVQWLKPYVNKQELLENVLNTRDYTQYSPAELLLRVGNAYYNANREFINKMREYTYVHGNLTVLHL